MAERKIGGIMSNVQFGGVIPDPGVVETGNSALIFNTNGDVLNFASTKLREIMILGGPIEDPEIKIIIQHLDDMVRHHQCFMKAGIREPLFTLRAQDSLSARLIRKWSKRAKAAGASKSKIDSARQLYSTFISWPGRRKPT